MAPADATFGEGLTWRPDFRTPSRLCSADWTEMSRLITPIAAIIALLAMPVAGEPASRAAVAQDGRALSWSEVKCARYTKAWTDALARRGRGGLGQEFIDRHEAFLASGCTARADVCPRSAEELDLANVLVVLAMNAGTASTFLPFACRR